MRKRNIKADENKLFFSEEHASQHLEKVSSQHVSRLPKQLETYFDILKNPTETSQRRAVDNAIFAISHEIFSLLNEWELRQDKRNSINEKYNKKTAKEHHVALASINTRVDKKIEEIMKSVVPYIEQDGKYIPNPDLKIISRDEIAKEIKDEIVAKFEHEYRKVLNSEEIQEFKLLFQKRLLRYIAKKQPDLSEDMLKVVESEDFDMFNLRAIFEHLKKAKLAEQKKEHTSVEIQPTPPQQEEIFDENDQLQPEVLDIVAHTPEDQPVEEIVPLDPVDEITPEPDQEEIQPEIQENPQDQIDNDGLNWRAPDFVPKAKNNDIEPKTYPNRRKAKNKEEFQNILIENGMKIEMQMRNFGFVKSSDSFHMIIDRDFGGKPKIESDKEFSEDFSKVLYAIHYINSRNWELYTSKNKHTHALNKEAFPLLDPEKIASHQVESIWFNNNVMYIYLPAINKSIIISDNHTGSSFQYATFVIKGPLAKRDIESGEFNIADVRQKYTTLRFVYYGESDWIRTFERIFFLANLSDLSTEERLAMETKPSLEKEDFCELIKKYFADKNLLTVNSYIQFAQGINHNESLSYSVPNTLVGAKRLLNMRNLRSSNLEYIKAEIYGDPEIIEKYESEDYSNSFERNSKVKTALKRAVEDQYLVNSEDEEEKRYQHLGNAGYAKFIDKIIDEKGQAVETAAEDTIAADSELQDISPKDIKDIVEQLFGLPLSPNTLTLWLGGGIVCCHKKYHILLWKRFVAVLENTNGSHDITIEHIEEEILLFEENWILKYGKKCRGFTPVEISEKMPTKAVSLIDAVKKNVKIRVKKPVKKISQFYTDHDSLRYEDIQIGKTYDGIIKNIQITEQGYSLYVGLGNKNNCRIFVRSSDVQNSLVKGPVEGNLIKVMINNKDDSNGYIYGLLKGSLGYRIERLKQNHLNYSAMTSETLYQAICFSSNIVAVNHDIKGLLTSALSATDTAVGDKIPVYLQKKTIEDGKPKFVFVAKDHKEERDSRIQEIEQHNFSKSDTLEKGVVYKAVVMNPDNGLLLLGKGITGQIDRKYLLEFVPLKKGQIVEVCLEKTKLEKTTSSNGAKKELYYFAPGDFAEDIMISEKISTFAEEHNQKLTLKNVNIGSTHTGIITSIKNGKFWIRLNNDISGYVYSQYVKDPTLDIGNEIRVRVRGFKGENTFVFDHIKL